MAKALKIAAPLGIFLVVAGSAPAASPPTRAEYVTQAEAICAGQAAALGPALSQYVRGTTKGLPQIGSATMLAKAWKRFFRKTGTLTIRGAAGVDAATAQLRQLTPPPSDAATISAWLASREVAASDRAELGRVTRKLQFFRMIMQRLGSEESSAKTDGLVVGFGFDHCLLTAK